MNEQEQRDAERALRLIDRVCVAHELREIDDATALARIKVLIGQWTDPKDADNAKAV